MRDPVLSIIPAIECGGLNVLIIVWEVGRRDRGSSTSHLVVESDGWEQWPTEKVGVLTCDRIKAWKCNMSTASLLKCRNDWPTQLQTAYAPIAPLSSFPGSPIRLKEEKVSKCNISAERSLTMYWSTGWGQLQLCQLSSTAFRHNYIDMSALVDHIR